METSAIDLGPLGLLPKFELPSKDTIPRLKALDSFSMERELKLATAYESRNRQQAAGHEKLESTWSLAPTLIREFKRFFSLGILYPRPRYPFVPSPAVDFVWHELITDTMRYAEVCEAVHGGFVHHKPMSPDQIAINAGEIFGYTKQCLRGAFGELIPSIWGLPAGCDYAPEILW